MTSVNIKFLGDVAVITPQKNLVGSNETEELADCLKEITDSSNLSIVVDLTNISFMNSSGLGALIQGSKDARATGRRLTLCALNDRNRRLIEVLRLEKLFGICESQEKAVANFAA